MVDRKSRRRSSRGAGKMFASFDSKQIQEFKEAFTMIDQDRDGVINADDLKEIYMSLGKSMKDSAIDGMLKESKTALNFSAFLTMFGEKLNGTDPEETIFNAFKMYDPKEKGIISTKELKEILTEHGREKNRLTQSQFTQLLEGAPVNAKGELDYVEFARLITKGAADES
ncbi:hypothetical protein ACOME3_000360 [Neoechinorhynchus agilis]